MSAPLREPWWWRVIAWLPARCYTPCAVCLFWRGALVGAVLTALLLCIAIWIARV